MVLPVAADLDGELGSQGRLQAAFLRYERAIKRVIWRVMGSRDGVDDLAQEVFVRVVLTNRHSQVDNAKAYLFEAARNAARTERSKRTRKILEAIEDCTDPSVHGNEPSAEDVTIARERLSLFCEAVVLLPPQCRSVFTMCKVQCKSHKEISATLGISESTVEKHVATGLARCAAYIRSRESVGSQMGRVQQIDVRRGS